MGAPRFAETWCSQCGRSQGPGDHGYSHCENHRRRRTHAVNAPGPQYGVHLDETDLAHIESEIGDIAAHLAAIADDRAMTRLRLGLVRASVEKIAEALGLDPPQCRGVRR